jgi:calcium/calmodulin-dependent protein kinase I
LSCAFLHFDIFRSHYQLRVQSSDNDSNIKLADFGFAKKCARPQSLTTQCGTPGYVAPEILEGTPYDTQADLWSLGVIVYILLGGYPPFIEQNQRELFRKIRRAQYKFHDEYWSQVSEEAKNMIRSLLTVSPTTRKNATQIIKEDTWMHMGEDKLAGQDLGVNLSEFKKYNAKRKFKAAVKTVMATHKISSLGANFKKDLEDS